ncbi:MAG: SEC-C metal-binding domain-containing protein [Bacteroidota bacterium]|nr:SEC-C metal-binding domain-containing protein [Bacteroidota bacterium]
MEKNRRGRQNIMARLGSKKRPAVIRVQTMEKAEKIMAICNEHDWKVIVGIEPDKSEDISDVEQLLNRTITIGNIQSKIGRNDPCPCGSGLKFKKCCLKK